MKKSEMNCDEIRQLLIFYANNECEENIGKEVATHIALCNNCSAYFSILAKAFNQIEEEKKLAANPFLYTRILERLKEEPAEKKQLNIYSLLKESFAVIVIAAAIILGILIGYISKEYYIQPETTQASVADDATAQIVQFE